MSKMLWNHSALEVLEMIWASLHDPWIGQDPTYTTAFQYADWSSG